MKENHGLEAKAAPDDIFAVCGAPEGAGSEVAACGEGGTVVVIFSSSF